MAEENNEEAVGHSKKKWLIVGAIGATVIAALIVAFTLLWGNGDYPGSANGNGSLSGNGETGIGNAFYVGMPRPFVFVVPGDARERTVQIKVQLMVRGEEVRETVKRHIPLIEGTLHEVFSSSTAEELKTVEGKTKLRELALQEVRSALQGVTGQGLVEQVLFTSMVMQ